MKNIVGKSPRGKDYFPRPEIEKMIYRRLDSGTNIYLSAARRMGKTAIMQHLEDEPQENYEFKYLISESVNNATTYFKMLLESVRESKSIAKKSLDLLSDFLKRINKIEVFGTGIELKEAAPNEDKEVISVNEFKKVLESVDTQGKKVVLMIDEFPQTVENILKKHGKEVAIQFLQFNREIRQMQNEHIQYIFTGSIGLPVLAEKLDATRLINDLNVIPVEPLSTKEATQLFQKLLDTAKIAFTNDVTDYALAKIEYFSPFYVQLLVQYLIDESEGKQITPSHIDQALELVAGVRNNLYFEHYFSRLKNSFEERELPFVYAFLKNLAHRDMPLSEEETRALAHEKNLDNYAVIIRSLEFDGYVQYDTQKNYRFTAPLLKLWWAQYVR